jgi:hypothetical protein
VLQDALDLNRAVTATDRRRQEEEIADFESRLAAARRSDAPAGRLRLIEERLASARDDLEFMNKQSLRVDELLYQADRCGASLHRTRMELAALRADSSEDGVNAVIDTLRLTIRHAKGVQEEMKRLSSQDIAGVPWPASNTEGVPGGDRPEGQRG